jgi:hypothetical protein
MGVRVAGSLGANEEIEFSAKQFEKIWLSENREIIEMFLNKLSTICGITQNIKINKTEIIDVVNEMNDDGNAEQPTSSLEKEADARAQLRGSVGGVQGIIQIQTSVAEGTTDRSSAAALLELIYGFDPRESLRLLGNVEEGAQATPLAEGEVAPEGTETFVNDSLKGLSAKENADINRIIRDFMIQGGDPTATGRGGESIYGGKFEDEITIVKNTTSNLKFKLEPVISGDEIIFFQELFYYII